MQLLKKCIGNIMKLLPIKSRIMFESLPDLSDNTRAVFDEMLRKGINNEYELVWNIYDTSFRFSKIKGVKYCSGDSLINRFIRYYYIITSKCLICSNIFFNTKRKGQLSIYLTHGTPIKSLRNFYTIPESVDYCIAASKDVIDIYTHEFMCDANKIVPLGFPRNDLLNKQTIDVRRIFDYKYKKIIIWFPTYRQHENGAPVHGDNRLPIIHSIENAEALNETARLLNVLIIIKHHFVQKNEDVYWHDLSNIKVMNHFIEDMGHSYEFIGGCDAMITDYSSIYFDYTLCDKPVAVIWEDIEEYKKNPGLINNYEFYAQGAEKIYSLEDLQQFVERVANGTDILREKRNKIKELVNYSDDGKNAERVVDFILEKIEA